mgnify:CR=1 FL=1
MAFGLICSIILILSRNRKLLPLGAGGAVSGVAALFSTPAMFLPAVFIITAIGVEYYYDHKILKKLFPFYLSSLICGLAIEPAGAVYGTWNYDSIYGIAMVILSGYFSVFYIGWKGLEVLGWNGLGIIGEKHES